MTEPVDKHADVAARGPVRRAAAAKRLTAPIDAASLAVFRISFGAVMCWEVARYFAHDWIQHYYVTPAFHFQYFGFDWIRPWPGRGMFVHFAVLGVASALIMVGAWYRVAAVVFTIAFTYVFLLEQARYLNHFYLICLIGFLLIAVPADRVWSLGRRCSSETTAPAWCLWLLRFQIGIAYVFAGIAKLNPDWLRGEPLRTWMADSADWPIVGHLLLDERAVFLFAYGALLFDLLIVPALLWRRTRPYAFGLACVFHLMNTQLFTIGVFPYLMIAATTLFFDPAWPRHLLRRTMRELPCPPHGRSPNPPFRLSRMAHIGLITYVVIQLLVPVRHWWYAGNVAWTEEGHRFSWRMKLRDKDARASFIALDPVTHTRRDVDWQPYLATWQYREMSSRPDMILQFAHHVADDLQRQSGRRPEVHAVVWASLNNRVPQLLVDPAVDLTRVPRSLSPALWIRPMQP